MTPMKVWMMAATAAEQEALAQEVGTSRSYLYHLSATDDRNYAREPKPRLAAAIERATQRMARESKGRLPVVYRTDLVEACRGCEFAQKCLGPIAERTEFPVVKA